MVKGAGTANDKNHQQTTLFHRIKERLSKKLEETVFDIARKILPVLLLLLLNPYHILDRGSEISHNVVMSVVAPLYPRPGAGVDLAQDRIRVILLNQDDLDAGLFDGKRTWPPRLRDYATLLRKIAAFEPEEIFIDLNIGPHEGEDREGFRTIMARINRRIPIFLAELSHERSRDVAESGLPDISADPRFDAAITGRIPAEWHGYEGNYPLIVTDEAGRRQLTPATRLWLTDLEVRHRRADLTSTGQPFSQEDLKALLWLRQLDPQNRLGSDEKLAATPTEDPEPMMIRWGSSLPSGMEELGIRSADCQSFGQKSDWQTSLRVLVGGLSAHLSRDPEWNIVSHCPHHLTMNAGHLLEVMNDQNLGERALKGKIVLIGADVRGISDYWPSPTHGKVQGTLFHAMALDNFLNYQKNYLKDLPYGGSEIFVLVIEFILLLLMSIILPFPEELLFSDSKSNSGKKFVLWALTIFNASGIIILYLGGVPISICLILSLSIFSTVARAIHRRHTRLTTQHDNALAQRLGWYWGRLPAPHLRDWLRTCWLLLVTINSGLGAFTLFSGLSFLILITHNAQLF